MKKLISIATILTVAAMIAGPGAANAATADELQAQINTLLAQLSALQAQLGTSGGSAGSPAACAGVSFTANLTVGSTGTSVKCLQTMLNQSADTQVAATGAGSPGSETMYFGGLTQAAVSKYQAKNGISPTAGYVGPVTRAKLNAQLASGPVIPGTPNPISGTEGSYTVIVAEPPNSTYVSGNDRDIYGFAVTARGSDVSIGRVDLQVAVTDTNAVTQNPTTFINTLKVYCGDTLIKTVSSPVFTQDSAAVYYTQLSGFSCVISKDATKNIKISASTSSSIDNNRTLAVQIYGNGIRGRDGANIDSFQALATARTHTMQQPGQAVMTLSGASANPVSTNYYNDTTSGTTNLPLLVFQAKATGGDGTIKRISLDLTSTTASRILPSVVRLYDGDTLITSASDTLTRQYATFENFLLPIKANETKTLTVKGDFPSITGTSAEPLTNNRIATVTIPLNATLANGNIFERDANGSQTVCTVAAAVAGNNQYLFRAGTKITFLSGTATVTRGQDKDTASGVLKFKVEPFGGTLTPFRDASGGTATNVSNQMVIEAYYSGSGQPVGTSGLITLDRSISHATYTTVGNSVPDGGSDEVTVTMTVNNAQSTPVGSIMFKVDTITWDINNDGTLVYQGTGDNMADAWKSNYVYL